MCSDTATVVRMGAQVGGERFRLVHGEAELAFHLGRQRLGRFDVGQRAVDVLDREQPGDVEAERRGLDDRARRPSG